MLLKIGSRVHEIDYPTIMYTISAYDIAQDMYICTDQHGRYFAMRVIDLIVISEES